MKDRSSSLFATGRFTVREILDLAASGGDAWDEHLKTIFEWYQERMAAYARGALRSAAAVVVAFLAAALSDKAKIEPWHLGLGSVLVFALLLSSLWANSQLAHIQREYACSVRLYHQLRCFQHALATHVVETGA